MGTEDSSSFHRLLESQRESSELLVVRFLLQLTFFSQTCFSLQSKFLLSHLLVFLFKAGLEVDAVEGAAAHRLVHVLLEQPPVGLEQTEMETY